MLNPLGFLAVCVSVWIPYSAGVLQAWPQEHLVGQLFNRLGPSFQISPQEAQESVSLEGDSFDVFSLPSIRLDGET